MRGLFFLAALSTTFALTGVPASAEEPVLELQPTSPWRLDYGEETCRLGRTFGAGEDKYILFLEQSAPSAVFGLSLGGPAIGRFDDRRETEIAFGAAETAPETAYLGEFEGIGPAIMFYSLTIDPPGEAKEEVEKIDGFPVATSLPSIDEAIAAAAESITIRQQFKTPIRLQTGKLAAAIKSLNACSQDFVEHWDLDLEQHRTLTRMPVWKDYRNSVRRIVRDYPRTALRRGEMGFFRFRAMIETDGSVSDCHLYSATEMDALDSPICTAIMKASFEPALDANGEAMRSFYASTIAYIL